MVIQIGYFLSLALLIIFALCYIVYYFYDLRAFVSHAPFVPVNKNYIVSILSNAHLTKNMTMYELGCGDSRLLLAACHMYGVCGYGVDLNPFLLFVSKIKARILGVRNVHFIKQNFHSVSLHKADIVFMYLLPGTFGTITKKILKECRAGTLIISHRFAIHELETHLSKTIQQGSEKTYYYNI